MNVPPRPPEDTPYIGKMELFENQRTSVLPTQDPLFAMPAEQSKPSPKPGMPNWLRKELETRTGGFRSASWTRCSKCQAIVLAGLDDDVCAFTIQADPTPLTPRQEELCAWIGRRTYSATITRTIELDRRSTYAIGKPCSYGSIIPEHVCGKRFNGFLLPRGAQPTRAAEENNDPPF